jgi:hypothetical protein
MHKVSTREGSLNQRARSSVALADLLPRFVAKSALTFVTADLAQAYPGLWKGAIPTRWSRRRA